MRKRRNRRYNNHLWLYSIIACICLLTMGIGYALLSAENNFNIDVTKTIPPGAGDTIKELLGSSTSVASVASGTGTLEKIEQPATEQTSAQTEYRYRGANPNNYVTFNNEEWRIIGIVDGKVKLIRNESIGDKAWNSNKVNEWASSTLKTYLNGDYYNGLSTEAKGMIETSTWYLGGWNTPEIKTSLMYQKERGTTVYSGDSITRSTKTTDKIAIMYASDYGYAASGSCSNSYSLYDNSNGSDYRNSTCISNNWLYNNSINQWTLAPDSDYSVGAFCVLSSGVIVTGYLSNISGNGVRPVLYLKSNVLISGGNGSSLNPYQLTLS